MPRYIDADALTLKIDDWRVDLEETYGKNDEYVQCLESVLDMIEDAPTVDIVRCAECEHYYKDHYFECALHTASVKPEDFCGFGERRKDNETD